METLRRRPDRYPPQSGTIARLRPFQADLPWGKTISMNFRYLATAASRALAAAKDGPSLYEVCDPLLLVRHEGDAHLSKFYRTALCNPALRALLRRSGLPELRDQGRLEALRMVILRARRPFT